MYNSIVGIRRACESVGGWDYKGFSQDTHYSVMYPHVHPLHPPISIVRFPLEYMYICILCMCMYIYSTAYIVTSRAMK